MSCVQLFCQNLSLFAKLFLDNKSVFFDVTGFNYFLLVYTPPSPDPSSSTFLHNETDPTLPPPRPQIVGFFSKEKMSWDNNNLACILVFPPWQRKGLGSLLMGVSYEISRREGILGGPEKPISDLGKKGYRRFWAGEVARWLLGLDTAAQEEGGMEETVVDVETCSAATWIAPEDCLLVLREMGVVEDAGVAVDPRRVKEVVEEGVEGEESESREVRRVRVDKAAVRRWVAANGFGLERTCDPLGFVEGYAVQTEEVEEDG
jgi:GNAT superfamily N-acetyltransferase